MPNTIAALIGDAIARRVFPGAVVLIAEGNTLIHHAAYGSTMYDDPGSATVNLATRYDLASLTKVFTATAALQLLDAGAIALDDPVQRFLPELRASDVTVRHLLTHTSGLDLRLSALRDLPPQAIRDTIYATLPSVLPGSRAVYSNISSLLLGEMVARLRGRPLDEVIAQYIVAPLAMTETVFCPAPDLRPHIAPTERDDWRDLVHGVVHDESAFALGGVAGHAGLFGTAADLWRFCQAWLAGGPPLLHPATAAAAVANQTPELGLACGLGWMLQRPSFMGAAAPEAYGHTGFTGPVMLVLPRRQRCLVLLTNRTYPRRSPPAHHAIIAQIATLVCAV